MEGEEKAKMMEEIHKAGPQSGLQRTLLQIQIKNKRGKKEQSREVEKS